MQPQETNITPMHQFFIDVMLEQIVKDVKPKTKTK